MLKQIEATFHAALQHDVSLEGAQASLDVLRAEIDRYTERLSHIELPGATIEGLDRYAQAVDLMSEWLADGAQDGRGLQALELARSGDSLIKALHETTSAAVEEVLDDQAS